LISQNASFQTGAGGPVFYTWVDMTQYIREPFTLNDSIGGQMASGSFTMEIPEDFTPVLSINNLDWSKPIPPRIYIEIADVATSGELVYQKAFITSDISTVALRYASSFIEEDTGLTQTETAIYQHQVSFVSLLKAMEGITLPSISVTQPKNIFARQLVRQAGWSTFTNQVMAGPDPRQPIPVPIAANDNTLTGLTGTGVNSFIPPQNATGFIFPVGNTGDIRINDINTLGYVGTAQIRFRLAGPQVFRQVAPGWYNSAGVRITNLHDIRLSPAVPSANANWIAFITRSMTFNIGVDIIANYYNSSNAIINTITVTTPITNVQGQLDPPIALHPNPLSISNNNIPLTSILSSGLVRYSIPTNTSAAYVIITHRIKVPVQYLFGQINNRTFNRSAIPAELSSSMQAYANNSSVPPSLGGWFTSQSDSILNFYAPYVVQLTDLRTTVTSGTITETDLVGYQTCLDLVNKALRETVLKSSIHQQSPWHSSYRLDPVTAEILQGTVAPELTFNNYNLREFLRKVFTICGIELMLGTFVDGNGEIDFTRISHIKVGDNTTYNNLLAEEFVGHDQQLTLAEHNDTLESNLTNLIDLNNTVTDTIGLATAGLETAQVTQSSATFSVQYPIYWLRNAKLSGFAINFTSQNDSGGTINNIIRGNDPSLPLNSMLQTWDISTRIFERDIYNSLPDVNYNTYAARSSGTLSKGNCIYYTSGSNTIGGIGHQGPTIPAFNVFTATSSGIPDMALVEMLTVLAVQRIDTIGTFINPVFPPMQTPAVTFINIAFMTATLEYVPMHEFKYRHVSLDQARLGLNAARQVNAQDQTLAWEDVVTYISNEHTQTGDIVNTVVYKHSSINEVIPIGTYVGGGHVVTSTSMTIYNSYLEVSYTLTKNYKMQSEQLRLAIAYERFAVPFNYVRREVLYHIYLPITLGPPTGDSILIPRYHDAPIHTTSLGAGQVGLMLVASGLGFRNLQDNLIARATMSYEDTFNGQVLQSNRLITVKIHTVKAKNSISRIGRMIDNFTAGQQRIINGMAAAIPPDLRQQVFSQPFRYTDSLGRVASVEYELFIALSDNQQLLPDVVFPDATGLYFTGALYRSYARRDTGLLKDAREAYEFNTTTSVVPVHKDLLVCDITKVANRISFISTDFDLLNAESIITDITPVETYTLTSNLAAGNGGLRVDLSLVTPSSNPLQGTTVAIWYDGTADGEPNSLNMVFRNYQWVNNGNVFQTSLHVAATRFTLFSKQ